MAPMAGGSKFMRRHLMQWDPFRDLLRGWDEDTFAGDFIPAANIYQDSDSVIAELDLPGIDPDKVDITVENDVLTVSGSREEKEETKKEDFYRREVRVGSFTRSMILPMTVKGDQAKADYKDGVLKVTLPKAEEMKPKKIKVGVEKK
jgi:HSP20 family protein